MSKKRPPLEEWINEKTSRLKRSCKICEKYGPKSVEYQALEQFLDMTSVQRRGMTWTTFYKGYLQEHLNVPEGIGTWKDHIRRCMNRGSDL